MPEPLKFGDRVSFNKQYSFGSLSSAKQIIVARDEKDGIVAVASEGGFYQNLPVKMFTKIPSKLEQALSALEGIASIGGNLPDDRLTDKTGPNDAAHRGLMYCNARRIAQETIKTLKS